MRISFDVHTKGAKKKLEDEVDDKVDDLEKQLNRMVMELEANIKATAPVGKTGHYRAGWMLSPQGKMHWKIYNEVLYAVYLVYGTEKFKNVKDPNKYQKADISRGILHDIRRILFEWESEVKRDLNV